MLTNLLIIPTVMAAVQAFQTADKVAWKRLFAPKADFYDDGCPVVLNALRRKPLDVIAFYRSIA